VDVCPDCGQALRPTGFGPRVVQQVELPVIPLRIEEHRQHESYCPGCDKVHYGVLPPLVVHGGLLGPHLTALVAYLKSVCHGCDLSAAPEIAVFASSSAKTACDPWRS
jgi:transposase